MILTPLQIRILIGCAVVFVICEVIKIVLDIGLL